MANNEEFFKQTKVDLIDAAESARLEQIQGASHVTVYSFSPSPVSFIKENVKSDVEKFEIQEGL